MKRMLFTSILLCLVLMQALAYDFWYFKDYVGYRCTIIAGTKNIRLEGPVDYSPQDFEIPGTIIHNNETYTVTELGACFAKNNYYARKIILPKTLQKIGDHAFCGGFFNSVENVENVTDIGEAAFKDCADLSSINIPLLKSIADSTFAGCKSLAEVNIPLVTNIGVSAFEHCDSLSSINMPLVSRIGHAAFANCQSLSPMGLSHIISVGSGAFSGFKWDVVYLSNTLKEMWDDSFPMSLVINLSTQEPPLLGNAPFGFGKTLIKVPEEALHIYQVAEKWSDYAGQIISMSDITDYDVQTKAHDRTAGLIDVIGQNNLNKVISLKVKGAINSYDVILIRNKMLRLTYLDLSDVDIVACDHEYYAGCHTEDNVVGKRMFYNMNNLLSLKLPKSATVVDAGAVRDCKNLKEVDMQGNIAKINNSAFSGCNNLAKIDLPDGIVDIGSEAFLDCVSLGSLVIPKGVERIGTSAFSGCHNLGSLVIPKGVERIGASAFSRCYNLCNVQLPPSLKEIGGGAFRDCFKLETIQLPGLERIGDGAFSGCSRLEEIRLPSTLNSIGNTAFDCGALKRVYTYTVEPVSIDQNTFSNFTTATLYIPKQAWDNYYYNTQWSQFSKLEDFDEPYKYFYVNKDYTLDERFDGNPDIDVNPGGGLELPDNDKGNQDADTIHIKGDGKNWASIIANGNLNAKGLYVDITIRANRWYFFSFPFRVKRTNISCGAGARFVFRRYDGGLRAEHGHGGWIDVDSEYLEPWKGYIFQASIDCTLSVKIEKEQFGLLPKIDAKVDLEAHASANEQDASWNFVGNPFTSYYDINDMGYDCPITRWNSDTNSYEALRPGDDDYALHPFEAFFVQRPTDADQIGFSGDDRMTQIGSAKRAQAQAQKARVQGRFDVSRQIVNLSLSDGQTTDKTRVVFNADKTQAYERDCDAAKFDAAGASQLYTIEAQGGRMAINERPEGSVQIGFSADHSGDYVLSATRMDRPVLLRDNLLQTTYDLTQGDYHFSSEAGRYDHRFMLIIDKGTTGIADIVKTTGVNVKPTDSGLNITHLDGHALHIYGINGALYATRTTDGFLILAKGVYVVEVDGLKAKFMVK